MKLIRNRKNLLILAIAIIALFLVTCGFIDKAYAGGVCGDGTIYTATEQCDDGNLIDGDGCSATCQFQDFDCGLRAYDGTESVSFACSISTISPLKTAKGGNIYGVALENLICSSDLGCSAGNACVSSECVGPSISNIRIKTANSGVMALKKLVGSAPIACKPNITDTNFQGCIAGALGLASWAEVTDADLASLSGDLICSAMSISNILGVQCLTGLSGWLILSSNQLVSLPPEISNLNIAVLALEDNNLTSLPNEIGDLNNLESLSAEFNNLTTIPPGIENSTSLKNLYLSENNITSLPNEIGNLNSLQTLDLINNLLVSIPSQIGGLVNLNNLFLGENQLTSLPNEVGDLTSLKNVSLYNNPDLNSIPVAQPGMSLDNLFLTGTGPGLTCSHPNIPSWNATTINCDP